MKQWLDRVTGAVTMYRLVLYSLIALTAIALALSLIGQLGYSPIELVASAAVALVATISSNWVVARMLRVEPHAESSMITALLIFFIMAPAIDVVGLGSIALTGVIASVSKYLIAVRGRHIFNAAVLGAFVVTILAFAGVDGFSYAKWWIGTPFLLAPVAIGAFLILYRTQRITMGVVFVALATVVVMVMYTLAGTSPLQGLQDTLLSSPVIFFAGFMLSEPLTMPPRRWQQVAEAVIVALLFTIPFGFGIVTKSPQLALLVGNLLAFLVGQRRGIRLNFLGKKQIGPSTWELSFQPARPVRFVAGQYMELTIAHRKSDSRGSRRYFSISSAPSIDGPVTFAITVPDRSSSFKQALLDLEPNATVNGTSVGGDFALPRDAAEPLLLVAGGIGITPFASQLASATARGDRRDVIVVYAFSTAGQLPYADLLEASGARVVLFGPHGDSALPAGWEWGGDSRVTGDRLAELVPDVAQRHAFVSGPPALVNSIRQTLRTQGARRIHTDYFSGY